MKYLLFFCVLFQAITLIGQNPSIPSIRVYKSDKTIISFPLKEIDSMVHDSIVPFISLRMYKSDKTIITLLLKEIDSMVHFTIEPTVVRTMNALAINNRGIKAEASIVSKGNGTISLVGFCWNTTENPTVNSQNVKSTIVNENNFTSDILGLEKNTKYYIRAFAYNETGISYSNQIECTTLNNVDSIYSDITIGNQIWTSRNLDISNYRNGDPIRHAYNSQEWMDAENKKEGAWCYYKHDGKNGEKYGKLYNWYAVNDQRGLAPEGYHIPNGEEWTILSDFLGENAGKKMKSKNGWSNNGNGDNSSGFNGLSGGYCNNDGIFFNITELGNWWSSSESIAYDAWNLYLEFSNSEVYRNFDNENYGLSVRCLKN
jgi:uncharacterized protein (TIGR02145 family)